MIILLSCCKTKRKDAGVMPALERYSSDLFYKRYKFLKKKYPDAKMFILSAKFGVLELDDKIEYYDMYLKTFSKEEKQAWGQKVINQLKAKNINFDDEAYFATGKEYYEPLKDYFKNGKLEKDVIEEECTYGKDIKAGMGKANMYYKTELEEMNDLWD